MIGYLNSFRGNGVMASLPFYTLLVLSLANLVSSESSNSSLQQMLPAYAIAVNAETILNSSICGQDLVVFRDAVDIRRLWALKVLDSSGEPKAGFLYGNNYWLGSRAQCLDTSNKDPFQINLESLRNTSRFRKTEDEFPPYKINYFVAHFRHNSTMQYHVGYQNEHSITLGLCLPASCTTNEVSLVLEKMFQERTLTFSELYAVDFELEFVQDLQNHRVWLKNGKTILVLSTLAITLLLMIVGTIYDVLVYQKYLRDNRAMKKNRENDSSKDQMAEMEVPESPAPLEIKHPGIGGKILKSFSVYTNTINIFDTKIGADSLVILDGLRFLSMIFIIIGHTVYYMSDVIDNKTQNIRDIANFGEHTLITYALQSVDTFFFIGGFLVAYQYLKRSSKSTKKDKPVNWKANVKEFVSAILKRYIKLTPAYMMTVGIVEMVSAYHAEISGFYPFERPHENCAKYWWRNLLYINNLFKFNDVCLTWSWYLSADMQFFIIGTFIMILSSVYLYTALTFLVLILCSSMIISGAISYNVGFVTTVDTQLVTLTQIYYPPWMRIGPYIVGMATAFMLLKLDKKWTLSRKYLIGLWLLECFCQLSIIMSVLDRQLSVLSSAVYIALSHTAWGIAMSWLTIACYTNHGGIINTILSCKAWGPLSKLTFAAYLLNAFIIRSISMAGETSMHIEFWSAITWAFGMLCISYFCSYIYSLMIVLPYYHIAQIVIDKIDAI